MRIGMGYDVHKLAENRKMIIGGVEIPYERGLLGHSDADVLLHAVMDSLLGAAAMGDIGTHAFNLAEYVTGLKVVRICADLNIVVKGRKLDDDGVVLLKFENGATGLLYASQIAAGEENNVQILVSGEKGSVEWHQEDANTLSLKWQTKPTELYRTGTKYLSSFAAHNTRTPAGHPEGYLEAFANHYRNFALTVKAKAAGEIPKKEWLDFPGIEDGIRGMAFVENVVKSNQSDQKWMDFTI